MVFTTTASNTALNPTAYFDSKCENCGLAFDQHVERIVGQDVGGWDVLNHHCPKKIVVTRHPALVAYLIEVGLTGADTLVISHATAEDVRECHVYGVLPLRLAAAAAAVTEIPLALTPSHRGRELSISDMREIAGAPATYSVALG